MGSEGYPLTLSGDTGADLSERTTPSPRSWGNSDRADPFPRGHLIGRYVILDKVGAGGMGVVYAAYDPDLGRKIAIKVLREHATDDDWGNNSQGTMLLREAQAMALLSHPNALPVHDVGMVDGRVFIATEFVEGQTLRQWLAETPRSWKQIVAVFIDAGRGLAAAHRAGLIHRDFKPGNVMISVDGVVRVTDFGLARLATRRDGETDPSLPVRGEPTSGQRALESTLTVTGTVLGTPAYMAPEQNAGASLNASADQYSYCVALYEALFGRRPWKTPTAAPPSPRSSGAEKPGWDRRVPRWLRRVVERGLQAAPENRWPSMDALLNALEIHPIRRKRRLVWGGAALAMTVASGAIAAGFTDRVEPCGGARELADAIWTDELRTAIDVAFRRTERADAPHVAGRLFERIDGYFTDWVDTRTQACRATRVHHEQPELVMDRKLSCLDDKLAQVTAFLRALTTSTNQQTIDRARAQFDKMSSLELCTRADALARKHEIPIPARERAAAKALRDAVVQLNAAVAVGDAVSVATHQDKVTRLLEGVTHGPTRADSIWAQFGAAQVLGDHQRSVDLLADVRDLAALHDNRGLLAAVWSHKLWITAVEERRMEVAREIVPVLEVALELAKDEPDQMQRELEARRNLAVMELLAGNLEAAERRYREIDERLPDDPATLNSLGVVLIYRDKLEQARDVLLAGQRALDEQGGPRHPNMSDFYNNRALSHQWQGDLSAAEPLYRRAVEVASLVGGGNHLKLMLHRFYLGQLLADAERWPEAQSEIDHALEGIVNLLGERSEFALHARVQKVRIALGQGDIAQAREMMNAVRRDLPETGLSNFTRGHAQPDHIEGLLLLAEGRPEEAASAFDRALHAYREVYQADSLELVRPLIGLARARLEQGDDEQATVKLRLAENLLDAGDSVMQDPRRREIRMLVHKASGDTGNAPP